MKPWKSIHCILSLVTVLAFQWSCSNDSNFKGSEKRVARSIDNVAQSDPSSQSDDPSANAIVKLEIVPNPIELMVGQSQALTANGIFANGQSRDVTSEATWSSADGAIAPLETIAQVPNVVGLTPGTSKVNATFEGFSASADVTILPAGSLPAASISLAVNGIVATEHKLARHAIAKLTWSSVQVSDCVVKSGEITHGNGPSGETSLRAEAELTITATCSNRQNEPVVATTIIRVTDPTLVFTINGSPDAQVLPKGSAVLASWESINTEDCKLTAEGAELAGGAKGDHSSVLDKSKSYVVRCHDAAGTEVSATIDLRVSYAAALEMAAGTTDVIPASTSKRPISLYFVLDVTGSMASSINAVRTNINALVESLAAKNLSVRLAVVPFRDSSSDSPEPFQPNSDINNFKTYLGNLQATGGGDANEGGLFGIQRALSIMAAQPVLADEIKTIVLVSDNPVHVGGTSATRDCSLTSTASLFNALSAAEQKSLKIFYSGPTSGTTCSGFANLPTQMNSLLATALTGESDSSKRGGQVPWPLDTTSLVTNFTNMLINTIPPVALSCLNQKATIRLDGKELFQWESPDLRVVYDRLQANQMLSIAKVLSEAEFAAFQAGRGSITMTRCCVSAAAAASGKGFDSCLKTHTGTALDFTVSE